MARHDPALLSLGRSQRTAACAGHPGRRRSGRTTGLTLLLALPGLSLGLPHIGQAQTAQTDYSDAWRQNYRANWRKQWLAEYAASTAVVQKPEVAAKSAAVSHVQSKSAKQTHSSAPAHSAVRSQSTAKSKGAQHTAAQVAVTPQHSAPAANAKPVSVVKSTPAASTKSVSATKSATASNTNPVSRAKSAPAQAHAAPVANLNAINTKPAAASTPAVTAVTGLKPATPTQNQDVLAQTKTDLFTPEEGHSPVKSGSHLQDNAFAPVGDSWKMLAYLVPMLLVIVGCLNLLKRLQAKTGRLPGVLQSAANSGQARTPAPRTGGLWNAILGGFHLNKAREQAGHSIRVIESVPIGGSNVHLLEVRGRVLLLGASAGSMNLLAEFDSSTEVGSDDFRDLLYAAAADMDAIDYTQDDLPAVATMSVLEDMMRDTNQAVTQRARRLRTVQEVEGEA